MPTEKNIAILVNSTAGKGRALKIAGTITTLLTGMGHNFSQFMDDWPDDLTRFSDVWVIGGDGTLNYFLNRYKNCLVPVSLFKGGTGNDFSWKLYGDISVEAQVNLVLEASAKPVDAASCNDKLFINGVGIGFDGVVLQSMKAVRFIGGHLGYLLVVLRKIFSFKEYRYQFRVDERIINDRFLLLMVTNSSRTGGGFHVSPMADITDGKLNMILCSRLPVSGRLRYLPVIEKGKHLSLPFIQQHIIESVTIECEKELPAQLDGELIYASRFDIAILPGRFFFRF